MVKKAGRIRKGKKVVAVSGPFDPMHIGHVRYMQDAKKLGDYLVVILNNDNWHEVKGKQVFMPERDRKEIIEALACVDEVVLSYHKKGTKDISISKELAKIKPHIFAKGGDRHAHNIPGPEFDVCQRFGIEIISNVGRGGKVRSSSTILEEYTKKHHLVKKKGKK